MQRKVDRAASKAALMRDGHRLKHWARANGINDDSLKAYFRHVFSDKAPVAQAVVKALAAAGYLRFEK